MVNITVHILSSYKGGTGKTIMALSIALHCIANNKKFVLIDTNPQNSNIAEDIFSFFHANAPPIKGDLISTNKIIYTLSPDSDDDFPIYDATDRDPFGLARRIQMNDTSDTVFIIDTNVHIRSAPDDIFKKDAHHRVYTWFLWGWSSPRLDHQLDSILRATERLEKGWNSSQVIHVFNLYDYFISGGFLLSIRKASKTLKPLKGVLKEISKRAKRFTKNKCLGVYIDFETMKEVAANLHSDLARYIIADDVDMEELPNLWSQHLSDMINTAGNNFPYNILLIPTFFRELIMSTDRLVLSSPRSFNTIREQIRPMAEFIDVFMSLLERCGDGEMISHIPEDVLFPNKQKP